jgi:hypothetical protein
MKRARLASAALLAIILVLGPGVSQTAASTATPPVVIGTITIGEVCGGLSDVIAFLESRPESRLRDFLLAQARRVFEKHCAPA